MRAFVALTLPDELLDALEALQRGLPAGRPARRESLHLTLGFAGEQPEARIEALHEQLERIRAPAFEVALRGLGSFGHGAPSVLYADVVAGDGLLSLHRRVVAAMRAAGIDAPRGRYRPHVTLARFRGMPTAAEQARLARFLAERAGFAPPPFRACGFTLFRSQLHPQGARHEALATYPLAPGRDGPAAGTGGR